MGIMTEQVSSDGSRVTDTSEVTRHVSRLDIRSVSSQDLGRYTCLGKNLLGSNRATIDLMVKSKYGTGAIWEIGVIWAIWAIWAI